MRMWKLTRCWEIFCNHKTEEVFVLVCLFFNRNVTLKLPVHVTCVTWWWAPVVGGEWRAAPADNAGVTVALKSFKVRSGGSSLLLAMLFHAEGADGSHMTTGNRYGQLALTNQTQPHNALQTAYEWWKTWFFLFVSHRKVTFYSANHRGTKWKQCFWQVASPKFSLRCFTAAPERTPVALSRMSTYNEYSTEIFN